MSFQDRLNGFHLDHLRLALLSLAAVALLVLGASLIAQALHTDNAPTSGEAKVQAQSAPPAEAPVQIEMRQKIESQLAQSPDYLRFFDHLKQVFPAEYEKIIGSFARRAAQDGKTEDIDAMMSETVRALRLSHGILAAKANGPALERIFKIQLAMMQALSAKDHRLCVDFLYGGASEGFFRFSADNRALVADMALAGLDAINDGQLNGVERAPPGDSDFHDLEKALRERGLNAAETDALLDGKMPEPAIPDARMCTIGQIYLQTLDDMPEASRYRFYGLAVELMARA